MAAPQSRHHVDVHGPAAAPARVTKETRLRSTDDATAHGPLGRTTLRIIGWIRRFNTVMHYVAGFVLVALLALTVADITGRTGFDDPVPGTVEVTSLLLVAIVFLGLAHSEDRGDHISVDLLYIRVGKRLKAVLDVFADLVSMAVIGLLTYQLYQFAMRQREAGAESPVLEWPVWPFALVAALGALGYAVAIAFKLVLRAMGEPTGAEPDLMGESSGIEI